LIKCVCATVVDSMSVTFQMRDWALVLMQRALWQFPRLRSQADRHLMVPVIRWTNHLLRCLEARDGDSDIVAF